MNYERLELGDRLIIYIFGSPDRTETIQLLAPIQDFSMDENFTRQVERLRQKVAVMTDPEWNAFFHRVREEVGNVIRSLKAVMWSGIWDTMCDHAEMAAEIDCYRERKVENDGDKTEGNPFNGDTAEEPGSFLV